MTAAPEWIVVGLLRASIGLAIAALAVAACVRLLRPRAPRAERWAWWFVLAQGVILVPVAIPVPAGAWSPAMLPRSRPIAEPLPERPPGPKESSREAIIRDAGDRPVPRPDLAATPPSASQSPPDGVAISWPLVTLTAWFAGVLAFLALGVFRYRSFATRLLAARPASPEWEVEWRRVLDERAVRAPILLVVSRDVGPALCWTAAGHRLVVPGSLWAGLTSPERAAILRHELEHFRRGDLWTTLLARGLALLHWFNPLAWWAAARFEVQSEFLCDRASVGDDPPAFAALLLRLGSARPERFGVVQSAGNGGLCERIERLLDDPSATARWKRSLPIAVAAVMLATTTVRLQAVGALGMALDGQGDETLATGPRPPLPPRALVQLGTGDLRIRSSFITHIAFSPDGRLIAASEANAATPRVSLFDAGNGRLVKSISPPERPKGWVQCVAFSPDATKLAWGEIGGEVTLWDLTGDRLLFREKVHGEQVDDVAFSPDGRLMASAGGDVVRLRRVAMPAEVVRDFTPRPGRSPAPDPRQKGMGGFAGSGGVGCLAFTPDGTRLVAGTSSDATLFVWRISDGRLLRRIPDAHGTSGSGVSANPSLNCLTVTPDGSRIMSVGQSTKRLEETKLKYGAKNVTMSEVRFWDIETGQRVSDYRGDEDEGFGYGAMSRDGRRVAVGDFSRLRILAAATGQPERIIELPGCWGGRPAFSPDGTLVAMPIYNTVGLFEVATGRRLHHDARTPEGEFASGAWSPSGDRIVTGHSDGVVRVWEAASGKLLWHKVLAPVICPSGWNARPAFVGFSGDGKFVVAAGLRDDPVKYENGIVAIYEASSGRTVREVPQKEIRWGALAPDGRMVVVATSNGSWDDAHFIGIEVETGRTRWNNPPAEQAAGFMQLAGIGFHADSSLLEVSTRDANAIRFNGLTGREQKRFVADGRPADQPRAGRPRKPFVFTAAFSADGRTMVVSSNEWVCVWDVEAGMLRRRIPFPNVHGCFLALTLDGKTVATSEVLYAGEPGEDTIRLYDVETGKLVRTLQPVDDRSDVLVFSPDGTRLLSGFHRGTAIVWDVRRRPE